MAYAANGVGIRTPPSQSSRPSTRRCTSKPKPTRKHHSSVFFFFLLLSKLNPSVKRKVLASGLR
jgi:hypothetical protein